MASFVWYDGLNGTRKQENLSRDNWFRIPGIGESSAVHVKPPAVLRITAPSPRTIGGLRREPSGGASKAWGPRPSTPMGGAHRQFKIF